ncbi:MAG: hypothetical protein AAF485_17145 [Chloroflexota bacterium]
MNFIKRNPVKFYISLFVAGLTILYLWPSFVAANPLTTQQHLERAWKLANDIGVYTHRSEIFQTSHPTPRLENAGRSPKTERMITSGFVNLPQGEMHLTLDGLGGNQPAVEMKVEAGKAYGRHEGIEEWTVLEDSGQVISSGGDPLGFLVAMENVQAIDDDEAVQTLGSDFTTSEFVTPEAYKRYTFEINGAKYAQYIADQLEAQLQQSGELPAGLNLGMAEQYMSMKAHGEIWLDEAGLPVRQVLHMEFPAEPNAYEWHEAEVVTAFRGWDTDAIENQLFWAIPRLIENPSILISNPLSLAPNAEAIEDTLQGIGIMVGLSLLLAAFLLFVFTHRHSQKLYAGLSLAVIASMLVTPLLQLDHAHAFSQDQYARQIEHEQQQDLARAAEDMRIEMTEPDFKPRIDPLAGVAPSAVSPETDELMIPEPPQTINQEELFRPQLQTGFTCQTPVSPNDCDGDGLTDDIEQYKLGTNPNDIDTDGDYISDKVEVEGFLLNGVKWYLDPTSTDSNNDGIIDFIECQNLVDIAPNGTWPTAQLGTACENTDGDTTPDVFDFDNDGDGVPDSVDSAANFAGAVSTTAQSNLLFNLNNVTAGKTLLVDFELRPANPANLWQNNNVFDWPDDDKTGQITRVFTTTFADVSTNPNPVPALSNGDVTLTPMLQVKMPAPSANNANPTASLPVSGTVVSTAPVTNWLNIDMMNDYAITVSQDQTDSSIYAYVPLAQVTDQVGDTPVAWNARMVYQPTVATWGQAHEVKLIWFVTALTDSCDTSGLADPNDTAAARAWCNDLANWQTSERIIQTYYEDFNLTGLTVTEDHGTKTAVVAQTDALTANYETELWQMVRNLQRSFIIGDLVDTNNRFTIEEMKTRFDKDTSTLPANDEKLWEIDPSKIIVRDGSAADQTTALKNLQTTVPNLLTTAYGGASTNDVVNLLFAREDRTRSVSLEQPNAVSINSNTINVDVSYGPLTTYTAFNWAPYQYGGSSWNAYAAVDYALNEFDTALQSLTVAELHTMVKNNTIDDVDLARQGAILFLQNTYLTFHNGLADIVEIDGQLVSEDIINDADFALNGSSAVALIVADMIDLMATVAADEGIIYSNGNVVANSNFQATQLRSFLLENAAYGETKLATIIADGAGAVGGAGIEWVAKKIFKKFRKFRFKLSTKTMLTLFGPA